MNPPDFLNMLKKALIHNGYVIESSVLADFLHYLELLSKWNKIYNLTSICDTEKMIFLHLLDSLSISPYLHGNNIIDVGTGAGLPGIPLALLFPDKQFTLLDARLKKTRFLQQVVFELKLSNVCVETKRVEDFHPTVVFDSILSRAFTSINEMLMLTQHLIGDNGQFLAMKGVYPKLELKQIPQDFKVLAVHSLMIKGLNAERHLVCLQKECSWEKSLPSSTKKAV